MCKGVIWYCQLTSKEQLKQIYSVGHPFHLHAVVKFLHVL